MAQVHMMETGRQGAAGLGDNYNYPQAVVGMSV